MADYSIIKSLIQQVVKTNGEQEITGANLQNVLVSMINAVASSNNEDFDRINGNILNLLNYVDTENEDIRNEMQELANRLDTNRFGYNVSVFGLVAGVHTISTAVKNVPPAERFGGQKITFKTDAGWVTYQNTSLSIDNYEDVNNWVLDSGVNVEGDVTITNNPDYEDLTQNSQNELKFADKEYNADTFSGLGRVYLRKNIVSNKNVLTQAMLADENTIYIIQYDYDLNGASIQVPSNSVLKFDGGTFKNGTLIGSDSIILAGEYQIFKTSPFRYKGYSLNDEISYAKEPLDDYLYIDGTWCNNYVSPAWNGLEFLPQNEDASPFIKDYITLHNTGVGISLPSKTYGIYSNLEIRDRDFDGNNCTFVHCKLTDIYDANINIPSGATALNSNIYPHGLPLLYQNIYTYDGNLYNFTIDQSNISLSDYRIDLTMIWGNIGLVGKRGNNHSLIKNVRILNPFVCGFLGMANAVTFEDCYFYGSGEHQVYGRPNADVIFRNCTFENWENNQTIAEKRGAAFAAKIILPERDENHIIEFENCKFIKGNSYSGYTVNLEADECIIENCTTDLEPSRFSCTSGRQLVVRINDCDGIFYDINCLGLFYITNSIGSTGCLYDAIIVDNCQLSFFYMNKMNTRENIESSMQSAVRNLRIENTTFLVGDIAASDVQTVICGVYDVTLRNIRWSVDSSARDRTNISVITNASDTDLQGVDLIVNIIDCNFNFGKRDTAFFNSVHYDVIAINCEFCGQRNYVSGYLTKSNVFENVKSLAVSNVECLAGKDQTVLTLCNNGTIQYIEPYLAGSAPSSNTGLQKFDYTAKKPLWYNGSTWVTSDGLAYNILHSGTFGNKPTVATYNIPVGYPYFCTNKRTAEGATDGIIIYHKGEDVWVDALGRVIS